PLVSIVATRQSVLLLYLAVNRQATFGCRYAALRLWRGSHIGFHPGSDRLLVMRRAEKLVRATGPTWAAVTWREIMAETVCRWNMVLFKQPANKGCGSRGLRRGETIRFRADVFDADGAFVCAHAMIGTIAIAHHLVDVAVSINDVMCGDLAAT